MTTPTPNPVTLNITYDGQSGNAIIPDGEQALRADMDVRRTAVELLRAGDILGLHRPELPATAFDLFVVDRFHHPDGGILIYLRPKVPFGEVSGA